MARATWVATAVQMPSRPVADAADRAAAWNRIHENLDVALSMAESALRQHRPDLLLFPEFAFQGPPRGRGAREWIDLACCPVPGPITEPLQSLATAKRVYVAGNQFEWDPEWPAAFFNTSFLIDPGGDLLLRYRRVNTTMAVSPHDLMTEYLARYGLGGSFPVAATELGRLAIVPCGELSVPEVILHPTNDRRSKLQELSKIARALENLVVVVSANVAGLAGADTDGTALAGCSKIVDFGGSVLADAGPGADPDLVTAEIDVDGLRQARASTRPSNRLLYGRFEMYAPLYASARLYPGDRLRGGKAPSQAEAAAAQQEARENLARLGLLQPTEGAPLCQQEADNGRPDAGAQVAAVPSDGGRTAG